MEDYLVNFCAPCLLGIKPANLFSMKTSDYVKAEFNESALYEKGISIKILSSHTFRVQVFVYREKLLKEKLLTDEAVNVLSAFGYDMSGSIDVMLLQLAHRMQAFAESRNDNNSKKRYFPHEIGIFLGYPVKDVLEFYKKGGKDYICAGYWKVYSDEQAAYKIFKQYNDSKKMLTERLNSGASIYNLISA